MSLRTLRVCHLSDLHFVGNEKGLFALNRLDEALNGIASAIGGHGSVDVLVATGDFVLAHQNIKVENDNDKERRVEERLKAWRRSSDLLKGLANRLGVVVENILVCPGNQDVDRDDLFSGGHGLNEFNSQILTELNRPTDDLIPLTSFATLRKFNFPLKTMMPVYGVELNMMYSARQLTASWEHGGEEQKKKLTVPGLLSESACKEFTKALMAEWKVGTLLVVGHYPITIFDWYQAYEESINDASVSFWAMNHLASGWGNLLAVLADAADGDRRRAIMLHGDTHHQMPVSRVATGLYASTAGRLDDPGAGSQVSCHFRTYRINVSDMDRSTYRDFHYQRKIHSSDSPTESIDQQGDWLATTQSFPTITTSGRLEHSLVAPAETIEKVLPEPSETGQSIANAMLEKIRMFNLFQLRRIGSGNTEEGARAPQRLGHVRLGPILNDKDIFEGSLRLFERWADVRQEWYNKPKEGQLIVGVDTWGAALASQLALRMGIPSCGVTMRGLEQDERSEAIENRPVVEKFQDGRDFLIVTDIVVTGQTLKVLHDLILQHSKHTPSVAAVCLVAAKTSHLTTDINLPFSVGAVLTELEIPVVPRNWLPDVDVLPAESFGFGAFRN